TVQRISEASEDLEKPIKQLSVQEDIIQQWVSEVKEWTADGNKGRHQLRKKIAAEKRALEDAITKHNAVMGGTDKLPLPNELLAEENYLHHVSRGLHA
ncbi:hypothetical protein GOODEAATRI_034376, partial [Goodea atripinnis]